MLALLFVLCASISIQQRTYSDAVQIVGDCNHADFKAVFSKFHQHLKCATTGDNTLDKLFYNIKPGYSA